MSGSESVPTKRAVACFLHGGRKDRVERSLILQLCLRSNVAEPATDFRAQISRDVIQTITPTYALFESLGISMEKAL